MNNNSVCRTAPATPGRLKIKGTENYVYKTVFFFFLPFECKVLNFNIFLRGQYINKSIRKVSEKKIRKIFETHRKGKSRILRFFAEEVVLFILCLLVSEQLISALAMCFCLGASPFHQRHL